MRIRAFLRDISGDDESAATLRQHRQSEHIIAATIIVMTVVSCLEGCWTSSNNRTWDKAICSQLILRGR